MIFVSQNKGLTVKIKKKYYIRLRFPLNSQRCESGEPLYIL